MIKWHQSDITPEALEFISKPGAYKVVVEITTFKDAGTASFGFEVSTGTKFRIFLKTPSNVLLGSIERIEASWSESSTFTIDDDVKDIKVVFTDRYNIGKYWATIFSQELTFYSRMKNVLAPPTKLPAITLGTDVLGECSTRNKETSVKRYEKFVLLTGFGIGSQFPAQRRKYS